MTDRQSFLANIAANPDDDGPRLVWADWLEEQGEPDRAELIRVQVRAAMPAKIYPIDGVVTQLRTGRETVLFGKTRKTFGLSPGPEIRVGDYLQIGKKEWWKCIQVQGWDGVTRKDWMMEPCDVPTEFVTIGDRLALLDRAAVLKGRIHASAIFMTSSFVLLEFSRGMIDRVSCSFGDWLAHGDRLRELEWVPKVRLTDRPEIDVQTGSDRQSRFRLVGRDAWHDTSRFVWWQSMPRDAAKWLLEAEWTGTEFELPQLGQSPLLGAFSPWAVLDVRERDLRRRDEGTPEELDAAHVRAAELYRRTRRLDSTDLGDSVIDDVWRI